MAGKAKGPLKELPKLEEWLAPWEEDSDGKAIPEEDQKIDAPRLKKYLYGLLDDKLKLQGKVDEVTTRAEELEQKVADAPTPEKLTELQQEVTQTRKERDDLKKNAADPTEVLKYKIALRKGLTEVQAKRLLGSTEEELEQDADELLASFGGKGKPAGDKDDEGPIARGPRKNLVNGGDPEGQGGGGGDQEVDIDKWAQQYAARRR